MIPRFALLLLLALSACGTQTPLGSRVAGIYAEVTEFLEQHVAEVINAPAIPGLPDYALHFDADHRHEVDVGLVSTTGDQYTVEAWVRLPATIPMDREGGEIVGQHASGVDAKGTLDILGGRLRFLINTSTSAEDHHQLLSEEPMPLDAWVHAAGVYDGHTMQLYINGQESGSLPVVGNITGYNQRRSTRLGGYAGTATDHYWFSSDLDEVRIWSTARTEEQLRAHMHHHVEAQPGLIGYWPCDDGTGLTAKDISGNGHHGHLTNYEGSGYPTWVPGVFTQVDTTGGA